MALADLKNDAAQHRERLAKMKLDGMLPEKFAAVMRAELVENVLPLFEALVESIEEEVQVQVDELGQAVDELIDQSEDVLHPETTAQIVAVLEVGKLLASELERAIAGLSPGEQKRATDLITAYRQSAPLVEGILAQITLDASDDQTPAAGDVDEDPEDDPEDEDPDEDEDPEDDEVPHG